MVVLLEREYGLDPETLRVALDDVKGVLVTEESGTHDLYVCLMEALANAWRHSGGSMASLVIAKSGTGYACSVADDGHGYDTGLAEANPLPEDDYASHGRGLHIIRTLCGGHLELSEGGRRVSFVLDLPSEG